MNQTLGNRIARLRRRKDITQETMADLLKVMPQTVSDWENGTSFPDIILLPKSIILDVTVDELLAGLQAAPPIRVEPPVHEEPTVYEELPAIQYQSEGQRKKLEDMLLKIVVCSAAGDRVRVNLPIPLVQMALETGINVSQMAGKQDAMKSIDFEQVFRMVEKGAIGKLVDIESANGDFVEITVE